MYGEWDYSEPNTYGSFDNPTDYSYSPPGYSPGTEAAEHYSYEAGPNYEDTGGSMITGSTNPNPTQYPDWYTPGSSFSENQWSGNQGSGNTSSIKRAGENVPSSMGVLRSGFGANMSSGYGTGRLRGSLPAMEGPYTLDPTTFNLPTYDLNRVEALREQSMEPGARRLRDIAYAGQQRLGSEDINVQKEGLRSIMRGYGEGLGSVALGARKESLSQYGEEYKPLVTKAMADYTGEVRRKESEFDWKNKRAFALYSSAMRDYLSA